MLATGDAKAIGNVIVADAGARALLKLAGGARIYTSGPDKGRVDLNIRVDAELAANLGLVTFGPKVTGTANFTATVTLDQKTATGPRTSAWIGTAGYNGDLGAADLILNPTSGQLSQIQDAEAGNLGSAAFGSTTAPGQSGRVHGRPRPHHRAGACGGAERPDRRRSAGAPAARLGQRLKKTGGSRSRPTTRRRRTLRPA